MFQILLSFSLILLAQTAELSISTPQSGQILRGQVEISGNLDVPNFSSAQLDFAYGASNAADTWFSVQTFPQPVKDSILAVWDTTRLTDGDYNLRLRVILQDGSFQDFLVSDLRIRNDVPLPTDTPTSTPTATATFTLTPLVIGPLPTSTHPPDATTLTFPSPIPYPSNPASLTVPALYSNFGRGALIAVVLIVLFSLLLRLRRN